MPSLNQKAQRAKALKLLDRLPLATVLCLGDLMLDRYIYGQAERLSPEAPVPVVRVQSRKISLGGLGNVANNLAVLGVTVKAVGLVGDDPFGQELKGLLTKALNPEKPLIIVDPTRPTTVKTRLVAGIQQLVRYDEESTELLADPIAPKYETEAIKLLTKVKAVALSDYGKGVLSPSLLSSILAQAKERGLPTVVDPKGADYEPYRGATLVTPNCQELSLAVGKSIAKSDSKGLAEAGRKLMERHGLENLLITRSEEGMTLLEKNGHTQIIPTRARAVYDVSGAGDTVMGVMAAALAVGATLAEGAELAALAAGVVVGKVGAAVARPEEIRDSLAC
ncbi:MAG: D-glycero-beta-D-manno-heptose-7-phosphate kinase [Deltaproteobacteria bacterium]|jgi:D-beta-D-heptose 7-phosphate kinase/D-beta-D-heptose 1-phosphate adenosyltransferase|nr:D-glycero-beta-D-manno-heptose-7-phosphate kinase [Deltaproteobacteria bacterium]